MFFKMAEPIWAKGYKNEMNFTCGLRMEFDVSNDSDIVLMTASSAQYHIYIDGKPFSFGPTRCAHGFFRVDQWELTNKMKSGLHYIAIEAVGYNINGFDTLDQRPFITAELTVDGKAVAYTSAENESFKLFVLNDRVQKVQRYDFQRSFAECYHLKNSYARWRVGGNEETEAKAEKAESGILLGRELPNYCFNEVGPKYIIQSGSFKSGENPNYTRDRSVELVGTVLKGFKESEFEIYFSRELEGMVFSKEDEANNTYNEKTHIDLANEKYIMLSMAEIVTGFLSLKLSCNEKTCVYAIYDETLVDGDIIPYRQKAVNAIRLELEPGSYTFQSTDPVDFKYLKIAVSGGACRIENIYLRELKCPLEIKNSYSGDDTLLKQIFDAAVNTFMQNAPDVFTDCPVRERAGWLCDSYYTSITEFALTGENRIEKLFLENYLLPEKFDNIPDGMLPMCYPADHYDGNFIPNWAMWFVLELEQYVKRTSDFKIIERAKERVYKLIDYFKGYQNSDGLLENLDGWIFVEWSKAAEYTDGVNYPTNMLYAASLAAAGRMYGDAELSKTAADMKAVIIEQAFDGKWFHDNAVRNNGQLIRGDGISEVCQYYAFAFDTATFESFPELWETLKTEFAYGKERKNEYKNIFPINMLPGVSLRLTALDKAGEADIIIKEIKDRYGYMSKATGTLWEHIDTEASCVHGFASYAAYFILKYSSLKERVTDISDPYKATHFSDKINEQEKELEEHPYKKFAERQRAIQKTDPYFPTYHFTAPEETMNDPNGLCFWQGRWHLFYQAMPPESEILWGHAVTTDLVHWRDLPYALQPTVGKACWSGATYVEKERVIAAFYSLDEGIVIAVSNDPLLLNWERVGVIPKEPGTPYEIFDPCIWKQGEYYYALSAGKSELKGSERGIRTEYLFRSENLKDWEYMHKLLEGGFDCLPGDDGACPYFWPIGDKYIYFHFSHQSGCKYMVGNYDTENQKFHGLRGGSLNNYGISSSYAGGAAAPSAAPDGKDGVIAVYNISEALKGGKCNQIVCLPRRYTLTGSKNDELAVEPMIDYSAIRGEKTELNNVIIRKGTDNILDGISGNAMELYLEFDAEDTIPTIDISVLRSSGGEEATHIRCYRQRGMRNWDHFDECGGWEGTPYDTVIMIDNFSSSLNPDALCRAPELQSFFLNPKETLKLRIFIDKGIVEVFVNNRAALYARVYPTLSDSIGVSVTAKEKNTRLLKAISWQYN